MYYKNHTSYENFKQKLCMCALGMHTKFQLEILTINVISGIVYFCKIILESLRTVSETTPWFRDPSLAMDNPKLAGHLGL